MNFQCKTTDRNWGNIKVLNRSRKVSGSELELLGFLPGVIRVTEVTVGCSLEVLGFLEVQLPYCKNVSPGRQLESIQTHQ